MFMLSHYQSYIDKHIVVMRLVTELHALLLVSVTYLILVTRVRNSHGFLSTGLEGVILSSSCTQLWHWRGHHL